MFRTSIVKCNSNMNLTQFGLINCNCYLAEIKGSYRVQTSEVDLQNPFFAGRSYSGGLSFWMSVRPSRRKSQFLQNFRLLPWPHFLTYLMFIKTCETWQNWRMRFISVCQRVHAVLEVALMLDSFLKLLAFFGKLRTSVRHFHGLNLTLVSFRLSMS